MQNTSGDISQRTAVKAVRKLLAALQPLCVTQRFGQPDDQERNSGTTRKWRRYNNLPPAVAPVCEAVTPSGQRITYQDYTAVLQEYVSIIEISDVIADTHEDPILSEMMDKSGMQAAQTVELVTISILSSGSNRFFAGGNTRATVTLPPQRGDFRKILRTFDRNLAQPLTKIISATPGFNTTPVMGGFYAMMHTDLIPDVQHMPGFIEIAAYPHPEQAVPGEFGALDRVRFIATANFTPWTAAGGNSATLLSNGDSTGQPAACDVYPIIIVAKDSYAVVRLQGWKSAQIYVLNPGKPDKSDPAAQRGYVSWKLWYTAQILNDNWLLCYETGCTANPNW